MKKITPLLMVLFLGLSACSKKQDSLNRTDVSRSGVASNSPFQSMRKFAQIPVGKKISVASPAGSREVGNCTVTSYTETVGFDEQTVLDPTSDLFYVGSVFDPSTLSSGNYAPILDITKRPVNISVSLMGLQGSVFRTIVPTLSSYRESLNDILNEQMTGDQPSQASFTTERIYSEDQLQLAINTSFSIKSLAKIKASFNFNSDDKKTRIVTKFLQKFYTVDMDIPNDGIYVEELADPARFPNGSPVYVSTLTYGRLGLFFLESSESEASVKAALNASANFILGKVSFDATAEQKRILNESTIKLFSNGGSGTVTKSISGYEEFANWIAEGGAYGPNSRGAVLSYNLRNLSDFSIYSTNLTGNYNLKDCRPLTPIYRLYDTEYKGFLLSTNPNEGAGRFQNYGVAFYAYNAKIPSIPNLVPLYRTREGGGGYFYTLDINFRNYRISKYHAVDEGITCYVYTMDDPIPLAAEEFVAYYINTRPLSYPIYNYSFTDQIAKEQSFSWVLVNGKNFYAFRSANP